MGVLQETLTPETDQEKSTLPEFKVAPEPKEFLVAEESVDTKSQLVDSQAALQEIIEEEKIEPGYLDISEKFAELGEKLSSTQTAYQKKYSPVPYEGKEGDYFFMSLDAYNMILEEMPKVAKLISEEVRNKIPDPGTVEQWEQGKGIVSILVKAMIAESIKYGQWMAEGIAEEFKDKKDLSILEFCSGAGINTATLYIERKNQKPEGNTQIVSVDYAEGSLACAALVALSHGIPCRICNQDSLEKTKEDFNDGIIFVLEDAKKFIQQMPESKDVDVVVSDQGITYFTEEENLRIVNQLKNVLEPNTKLWLSSLEKNKSVVLDPAFKAMGMMGLVKLKENPDDQYVEENGVIKKTYTPETVAFFKLARKLFAKEMKTFFAYMGTLSQATESSVNLNREMLCPVSKFIEMSKNQRMDLKIVDDTFPGTENAPCKVLVAEL